MSYIAKPPEGFKTPYQTLLNVLTSRIVSKAATRECTEEELQYWLTVNEHDVNITIPQYNESIEKWEIVVHANLFERDVTIPLKYKPISVLNFFKKHLKETNILSTPFSASMFYITETTEHVLFTVEEGYDFSQGIKAYDLFIPPNIYTISRNKQKIIFDNTILTGEVEIVLL